jgi:hypothetical protein
MVSRFLTAKLAVAALTAVVAVGGVAAAAGVAKTASDHAKAKAVGKVDKAQSERGPDATGHAKAGLCRAWAAGNGRDKGGKAESTAFEALARAAGEAGQTSGSTADDKREQHAPAGTERVPDRADQNRPTTDG